MLLLQIISILIVSRLFGFLFTKIGQPTVIGEILAGILLGPSLFGYFYPQAFNFLFAVAAYFSTVRLSRESALAISFEVWP